MYSKPEVKEYGLYYSRLWNVVESEDWANLKEESGDGGRQSAEVRRRISEAGKGRIPWNKGKSDYLTDVQRKTMSAANCNKAPQSAETISKRALKNTGQKRTTVQIERMTLARQARTDVVSSETRVKMSIAKQGAVPWNKGLKTSIPSSSAKLWIITSPSGATETISNLKKWAEAHFLNYQSLHRNAKKGNPYKHYIIMPLMP